MAIALGDGVAFAAQDEEATAVGLEQGLPSLEEPVDQRLNFMCLDQLCRKAVQGQQLVFVQVVASGIAHVDNDVSRLEHGIVGYRRPDGKIRAMMLWPGLLQVDI